MREAVIHLTDEELERLGFGELVGHLREAGPRSIEMLDDEGYTCVPQVEVAEELDHDLLDRLECVTDWELLAEGPDGYRYLLDLTATGLSPELGEAYDRLLGDSDPTVAADGLYLSFVGAQEAIRQVLRYYHDAGASPDLRRLARYRGDGASTSALTDRQYEVLSTALDLGFYEVPREASIDDVATALELNPSTISEHLQRAERNLLTKQLKA